MATFGRGADRSHGVGAYGFNISQKFTLRDWAWLRELSGQTGVIGVKLLV